MSPEPIWPQLLLQLILILLNAFFAAAELAVLSLNENVVRRQAEDGDKKAALLLRIVQNPTKFLSTIQIGITLAGFLGAAYAADNFASRITSWLVDGLGFTALPEEAVHSVSVILITVALSFLTLIFGELVPKRGRDPDPLRGHEPLHRPAHHLHQRGAAPDGRGPQRR